jgi:hypothetical protein
MPLETLLTGSSLKNKPQQLLPKNHRRGFDPRATKPKTKNRKPKKMNTTDLQYVRSVLANKIAANVQDGHLQPPAGAKCKTRSGFRAWLRRAEKAK